MDSNDWKILKYHIHENPTFRSLKIYESGIHVNLNGQRWDNFIGAGYIFLRGQNREMTGLKYMTMVVSEPTIFLNLSREYREYCMLMGWGIKKTKSLLRDLIS